MTDPTVPVTQEDRRAAASVYQRFRDHDFAKWIIDGSNAGGDADFVIQLFARHRIAHQPTPVEGDEAMVEAMAQVMWESQPNPTNGYSWLELTHYEKGTSAHRSAETFRSVSRALLPILSQVRADARREGMEQAARIADDYRVDWAQGTCENIDMLATAIRTTIEQGARNAGE